MIHKSVDILLESIVEKIEPLDFKALANNLNKNSKKLRERDTIVLVIDYVFKTVKKYDTGFITENGCNYIYCETHWQSISNERLKLFLSDCACRMGANYIDTKHYQFQDALIKQFTTIVEGASIPTYERPCVNLQNGTYDFMISTLKEHSHNNGCKYVLPFNYDPKAKCPIFDEFIQKVLPEQGSQDVLSEYIGSIFVPTKSLKLEKTLLLYGSGANGKSVIFEIINALLGKANITNYSLDKLTDKTGYYRAKVANKLLNYASELHQNIDITIFKQLVSREPVDARLPYGQPFLMRNYGRLMFNCNELPIYVEHNNAYFRRFIIIPFSITIPESEQDKSLAQRIISNELSGVFNWILEGMKRLIKNECLTYSEAASRQLENYKIESDSVKLFLHENNYVAGNESFELSTPLYQNYRNFCNEEGYKNPVSNKSFRMRLINHGIKVTRHNAGGYKIYVNRKQVLNVPEVTQLKKLF